MVVLLQAGKWKDILMFDGLQIVGVKGLVIAFYNHTRWRKNYMTNHLRYRQKMHLLCFRSSSHIC